MAVPARAYDALYDNTYTVSGARDHYRQQTVAGGFMVERAPNYPTMFSELPHFPATAYKLKNSDKVPAFVDRSFRETFRNPLDLTARSQPTVVTGQQRYKYFRRPLLAAPDPVIIKQANAAPIAAAPPPIEEPRSKTIGTQSDYRESEAQTLPWDPKYVLPEASLKQKYLSDRHNCEGPELLQLQDLKFGDGLPPGLQEVRRIEKMREKRAFEATLPPINDLEQLSLRQRMIEEWENKEWREREQEILSVQDERLTLLEQALNVREEEIDEATMRRVEDRKTAMLQERSGRFATIQASRIKTMRQLIEARKYVERPRKLQKPTVVERYANFGSNTYAPVQREGRFPDNKTIETEGFQPVTLQGISELESHLPARLLNPKIHVPAKPVKLNYKQRQDAAVQRDLKAINDLLDTAKSSKGRGFGDCWPSPLRDPADSSQHTMRKSAVRATDRPETPELPPATTTASGREAAAILLQRLLRGRAIQNIMYEGKMRRHELIQELRLDEQGAAASTRPEEQDAVTAKLDAVVGSVVAELCAVLSENDSQRRNALLTTLLQQKSHPPARQPSTSRHNAPSARPGSSGAAAAAPASRPGSRQRTPDGGAGSELLDISPEQAEAAAVRIQAAFKGHKARKTVQAMRVRGAELRQEVLSHAEAAMHQLRVPTPPGGRPRSGASGSRPVSSGRRQVRPGSGGSGGASGLDPDFLQSLQESVPDLESKVTRIQAMARGRKARKEVRGLINERRRSDPGQEEPARLPDWANDPEVEAQVVKLQALQRGRAARKQVKGMRGGRPGSAADAGRGSDTGARSSPVPDWANDPEVEAQVVKLQALQRGRAARKQMKQKLAGRPGSAGSAPKAQRDSDPGQGDSTQLPDWASDPQVEAQVVKIQALQRGRMARKQRKAGGRVGSAGSAPGTKRRSDSGQASYENPDWASDPQLEAQVVKIQALQRGRMARKQVKAGTRGGSAGSAPAARRSSDPGQESYELPDWANDPEVQAKVVKIQALQRGRLARKQAAAQPEARPAPADTPRSSATSITMQNDPDLEQKVIKIQALARGRAARKQLRQESLKQQQKQVAGDTGAAAATKPGSRGSSSTVLASVWSQDAELEAKVVKIQALQRGRQARRKMQDKMAAAHQGQADAAGLQGEPSLVDGMPGGEPEGLQVESSLGPVPGEQEE
eukprot:CAMPEP_0202922768 /NCGR_PEP_ID=MMETSP1392-20130828/78098_1 /ASSEMBLY_ACC=CAM_ASM_000868 /TAXON_ID=225041 /ORGANISM="Chlamydomonas chlamydogama, Strain SAG 11-48b" /LENGTH=1175 /DNA_ID=CAMNT_0049616413 /DNA_START=82 /DNA_END=3609 /DNA_ORIENTATION=-